MNQMIVFKLFTHLSLSKATLSLNEGHDLESTEVDLQVLHVVLGHFVRRTPSATVCLAPNSAQKKTR